MRLIDADKALAEAKRISGPITGDGWDNYGVYALIERQPTVEAVPLDKLCDWLAANASYIFGDYKNTWKFEARHWKDVLTKWMEEQDAADRCRTF